MSCSCCCCVSPSGELLDGVRKKERLMRLQQEEEEEDSRRSMDISLLREQYRCTRETQKRHTQVLLFRTVSEELSEAVSIIPVPQGLTSPWEPNSSSPPPAVTFNPDPTTCDPWHVHLGLHRHCCLRVTAQQLIASSPETTNTNSSSQHSSSSCESVSRKLFVDLTSDSPCSSICSTKEEVPSDTSRVDTENMDPVQLHVSGSLDAAEQHSRDGSKEESSAGSFSDPREFSATGSDESSTPVASISYSPSSSITSLHEDLKEHQSADRTTGNVVPQTGSTSSAWRGSRKFSAPALRFARQFSVGGVGSSAEVHHPFPNRKTPRISEAARRLGMYSSF
ncbi:uncharacterized protein LOC126398135 [Epinephelus moara]|uniref:uncharacterized protein LOC126398135 n=1 Tax=Epinephelus moara TaxID=300413 RepID=UPI00214F1A07|nr:uncharacterized protein LOC126398135 [Epinephelus moara]